MTAYRTKVGCCPPVITGVGGKRPIECQHGNRFQTEKELALQLGSPVSPDDLKGTPRRRSSLRRSKPRRDWSLAIAKKDEEGDVCRITGEIGTELAHVLGRKYDEPITHGSKTLLVLPDRVVPLAPRIHVAYDAHELDLLPYLTTAEQAQAVLDAGSIGLALQRISPESDVHAVEAAITS